MTGPERLLERFCGSDASGLRADPGIARKAGVTIGRGFCGFKGGHGDWLDTGFDDGYIFMDFLSEQGWVPLSKKGDWPYLVYMAWRRHPPAIAEYREGDFTIWIFSSHELTRQHYASLNSG